jgi:outer membrane cobalamin receptor
VKGKRCNGFTAFIFLSFLFRKQSQKKHFSKNEKEDFYCGCCYFQRQLQAQKPAQVISGDTTKNLDEVVITANKYPQKQSSTGKVLTVINRDQLEKNTGRSLAQVLNDQAGIIVNGSQNPLGTNQLLYMRGAGSANTLILVDGVPANDAAGISGEFDINHFNVDQIERVEILKGLNQYYMARMQWQV